MFFEKGLGFFKKSLTFFQQGLTFFSAPFFVIFQALIGWGIFLLFYLQKQATFPHKNYNKSVSSGMVKMESRVVMKMPCAMRRSSLP